MKKYIIASIIALVAMVTGVNVFHSNSELALSNIALANVEALADNESGCHDTNGYRQHSVTNDGTQKKEFRDCCSELKEGWSPIESCK